MNASTAERFADEAQLVTADGYEQLRSRLMKLRTDGRRRMSERLREAREDGHLADNTALYELLEEQERLEQTIALLERQLAAAAIATPAADGTAGIGSFVRVRDLQTRDVAEYELVGAIEAAATQGRVSIDAPFGRALIGQRPGTVVRVEAPRGVLAFELLAVGSPQTGAQVRKAA